MPKKKKVEISKEPFDTCKDCYEMYRKSNRMIVCGTGGISEKARKKFIKPCLTYAPKDKKRSVHRVSRPF